MSVQDRIRSLDLNHIRTAPTPPHLLNSKPPVPPRLPPRSASTEIRLNSESVQPTINNQPNHAEARPQAPIIPERSKLPLPPPRPVTHSRTTSNQSLKVTDQPNNRGLNRRDSSDSLSSTVSTRSSLSTSSTRINPVTSNTQKLPGGSASKCNPYRVPLYDPASIPPLPPKRHEQARPPFKHSASSSSLQSPQPPKLPPRGDESPGPRPGQTRLSSTSSQIAPSPCIPAIKQSSPVPDAVPLPRQRSALSYGMNKSTETPPPIPLKIEPPVVTDEVPPIPANSKPNLAALQASKPSYGASISARSITSSSNGPCMKCRDFTGPDSHASRFPRQSIPSTDVRWLAQELTSPFDSNTDRARVLFTWCHHNIAYNTEAFFAGNMKATTPATTIQSGLAVCSGYAGLFTALASAVGLESVVLSGHGMGFAKSPIGPNEPTPPEDLSGHAWNAVKIDGGQWKLIDPCWGAGHISDDKKYVKKFDPSWFCMDNNQFGKKHYPSSPQEQFRTDGRVVSWDEYIRGGPEGNYEKVKIYTGCKEEHGLDEESFLPKRKHLQVRGAPASQRVQFMFRKYCEHWDNERMGAGKPYVFLLDVGGRDGRERKKIPFQTNGDHWWVDVATQDLGCSGQTISVYALTTVDGKNARGWTPQQWEAAVGRKSMSWTGVAAWQLA